MKREEEIIKIGKKIQREIDKLKKYRCTIDLSGNTYGIFDNTIEPIKGKGYDEDYENQIVFTFDTIS